jgi:hypothetical protein
LVFEVKRGLRHSQTDILELRDKYERLLVLRTAHARAKSDPTFSEADPTEEMRRLAAVYPGSLREIDTLTVTEITTRITKLTRVADGVSHIEEWMIAHALFHRLARGALLLKRWLRGRKHITPALRLELSDAIQRSGQAEARLFEDDLALVATPPRGRLMDVVFGRIAAELHITVEDARALVINHREIERESSQEGRKVGRSEG